MDKGSSLTKGLAICVDETMEGCHVPIIDEGSRERSEQR